MQNKGVKQGVNKHNLSLNKDNKASKNSLILNKGPAFVEDGLLIPMMIGEEVVSRPSRYLDPEPPSDEVC